MTLNYFPAPFQYKYPDVLYPQQTLLIL